MRLLLPALVLVCVMFKFASAGPGETGGAQPTPTPPPCEDCMGTGGGGTNSAATSDPSFTVVYVNGIPILIPTGY